MEKRWQVTLLPGPTGVFARSLEGQALSLKKENHLYRFWARIAPTADIELALTTSEGLWALLPAGAPKDWRVGAQIDPTGDGTLTARWTTPPKGDEPFVFLVDDLGPSPTAGNERITTLHKKLYP